MLSSLNWLSSCLLYSVYFDHVVLLQRISNPGDFVKYISGKMSLWAKESIAQKLLLRSKIKKVPSSAHVCSMERKARNAHDENEQTLQES